MFTLLLYLWFTGHGEIEWNSEIAFGFAVFDLIALQIASSFTPVGIVN